MKIMYLSAVLLLLLTLVPAVPAAECTKSYLIQLELSPSGVTEISTQLVYGSATIINSSSMDLKGEIVDGNGRSLSSFWLWDPRIQFGEDAIMDKNGTVKKFEGVKRTAARADLVFSLPYSPDAVIFRLYNNQSTLLKTVNLTKAQNGLTYNCTAEMYAQVTPPKSAGAGTDGMTPIVAVLIMVCVAAGTSLDLTKKRNGGDR
jgi:hypothetical protein